jgi:hypothetical protein
MMEQVETFFSAIPQVDFAALVQQFLPWNVVNSELALWASVLGLLLFVVAASQIFGWLCGKLATLLPRT